MKFCFLVLLFSRYVILSKLFNKFEFKFFRLFNMDVVVIIFIRGVVVNFK